MQHVLRFSDANDVTYDQGVVSTFQTQHAEGSTSDDHVMVYELTVLIR